MEGQLLELVSIWPREVFKQRLGGQERDFEGGLTPVGNGIRRYVSPFHR